jgi:heptosyltransferase-1
MRILLVKMSSLGDVIHALAAVSDAAALVPGIEIDWVVEEAFQEIPAMHPAVRQVLPIAIRRWREGWWRQRKDIQQTLGKMRATDYDLVIDAQGLIKSAIVSGLARGPVAGLDTASSREPLASRFYTKAVNVPRDQHAVVRLRQLLALALDYAVPTTEADFGLGSIGLEKPGLEKSDIRKKSNQPGIPARTILFFHGTTWASKHWPVSQWQALAQLVAAAGYEVLLPHGNAVELARAEAIAATCASARVLPKLSLTALAECLREVAGVVSVDTGLGHLAAALAVPMVSLYGPTNPLLTAPYGRQQSALASTHLPCIPCMRKTCKFAEGDTGGEVYPPCFAPATTLKVWQTLLAQMDGSVS